MKKRVEILMVLLVGVVTILNAQKCLEGNCYDTYSVCVYPSGAKYEGFFQNGKIHGKGKLTFSNGNKYEGDWKQHYREGNGKMTFNNGDIYQGQFKKSKIEGQGEMKYSNGDIYKGQWVADKSNGIGTYNFAGGERYEGEFVDGKFQGKGTMYYKDGASYSGFWYNNKKHGEGTLVKNDGTKVQGNWENGKLVTESTEVVWQSKPKVEVKIESEQPASKPAKVSEFIYGDGSKWIGEMNNGFPEGNGTCYYAGGDKYVGGWKEHAPHGDGIMYYSNGRVVGAVWNYGRYVKDIEPPKEDFDNNTVTPEFSRGVKVWALVVGVGAYPHMPPLKYTDDDAYRFHTFLKSPAGGALPDEQIKLLVDEEANRENILKTMQTLFLKADENDAVVLYFSGHGLEGSFIPYDFDGYNNRLRHQDVLTIFNQSKAKHKLCIADACHSGSLFAAKGISANAQSALNRYYKAFENSTGGTALLMSSRSEENSLEDHGLRSGVFTHFLIKGMKGEADADKDRIVTIQEIYNFTNAKVREYTLGMQSPTLTGSYDENMPVAAPLLRF